MTDRHKAIPAAYVLLERDGKILMLRRENTGYMDGKLQMPSGHVEDGELPSEGAIREVKEEVGVDIAPEDLALVHASYRVKADGANRTRCDYFFHTTKWNGEPFNAEPEKCTELVWIPLTEAHSDTVPIIQEVLEYIRKGQQYSEIRHES